LKKKTKIILVQNKFFLSVGPMKILFSFSTAQTEKNWKTKLMVLCHEQDTWQVKKTKNLTLKTVLF